MGTSLSLPENKNEPAGFTVHSQLRDENHTPKLSEKKNRHKLCATGDFALFYFEITFWPCKQLMGSINKN
ncbi:hypothetical protein [Oxalobacter formigenes]|nr:hypothetical protein [Oxalobacter formigenes]ARQ78444.1 hypothetical protein BRW84_07345 [Oxalobacter formigenes OXCC13]